MKNNKKIYEKKCENPIKFLALKLKLFAFGIGFLSIVDGNSPKAVPHDQLSEVINFSDQSLFTKWGEIFFDIVKFIFSKKAMKIDEIFTVDLTFTK